ncbi:MAG TPA: BrnT family toxin [Candidatus Sulfotelmatobacter sp.]
MRFEWDEEKNRRNLAKHGIRFETAALAFEDPHALTQRDPFSESEQRWITLGTIETVTVLFIVHTSFEHEEEEVVRIISARTATPRERKQYEEAQQGTERRHRKARRHERRRH